METYDVIVAGAGPAGATAAFFLSQAGKRVLVLEKEHLPRYKTCGGGVSGEFLRQFPFSFEPVIESTVKSISYAWKDHQVNFPFTEELMRMVMRDLFDEYILRQSQAEVREGVQVKQVVETDQDVRVQTRDGQEFCARYLVGADGANSMVAHSLGLRKGRTLAAAIEAEVKVPGEIFQRYQDAPVFLFGDIPMGYLWIFPKHDHLSVGIGSLHPRRGKLKETLKQVMARYGISLEGAVISGHPLPIFVRWEQIATRRTCLVGDAAGLVDPFNGEGIRYAMKSGMMAARAILNENTRQYQREVFWKIGLNFTFAWLLAVIFYYLTPACYYLGVRNPFATRAFMDMLADRVGYPLVLVQLAGSIPIYLGVELLSLLGRVFGGASLQKRIWQTVQTMLL